MSKKCFLISLLIVFGLTVSCNSGESQREIFDDANKHIATRQPLNGITNSSNENVESLCDRLIELRIMPYSVEDVADDPIYDGLVKKGKKAIPCLVDKITDTTVMKDPRTAPHVEDFKVGDAAVFMLLYITKEEWQPETMLSPEFAKLWTTEGVYAYFAYVEKPENRKQLQHWWKDWMKENLN